MFKIMLPVNLFIQIDKENPPIMPCGRGFMEHGALDKYFLFKKIQATYKLPLQRTKAV